VGTTAAIIAARLGSSRLPNKALADINGHPMLWHVVNRARRIPGVDQVVVATSFSAADQRLISWCQREGIPVYRGGAHENDVLGRYFDVATQLGADTIVRLTGDCPCFMPEIGTGVLRALIEQDASYASNVENDRYIDGFDCEALTMELLEQSHYKALKPAEREHVTLWARKHAKKKADYVPDVVLPKVKLSVDTLEELDLVRAMFADLGDDFGLAEVLAWCEKREAKDDAAKDA